MSTNMGFGDLVRHREIGSNTTIKRNIDESVSIMQSLLNIVAFVKFSDRVIDTKFLLLVHCGKYSKGLSLTLEYAEYAF